MCTAREAHKKVFENKVFNEWMVLKEDWTTEKDIESSFPFA